MSRTITQRPRAVKCRKCGTIFGTAYLTKFRKCRPSCIHEEQKTSSRGVSSEIIIGKIIEKINPSRVDKLFSEMEHTSKIKYSQKLELFQFYDVVYDLDYIFYMKNLTLDTYQLCAEFSNVYLKTNYKIPKNIEDGVITF